MDDLPPTTVVLSVQANGDRMTVRGTAADNGTVAKVVVNGVGGTGDGEELRGVGGDGTDGPAVEAHAEDAAGNVEKLVHRVVR